MRRTPAAVALLMLLSVSACAEPDAKEATGNTDAAKATEDAVSNQEIAAYLDAIAADDPDEMESVRSESVEPGSLADAYLFHRIYSSNASSDAGFPSEGQEVKDVSDGYELCATETVEGEEPCTKFTDFTSSNGKLADFKVGGKDLRERLSVGDGSKKSAGPLGSIEYLAAYQSVQSGALFVHTRIKTKDQTIGGLYGVARYRAPDGRQSTATDTWTPEEIEPDSLAYVTFIFERAKPGGRVTVPMADPDYTVERTVKFKTR